MEQKLKMDLSGTINQTLIKMNVTLDSLYEYEYNNMQDVALAKLFPNNNYLHKTSNVQDLLRLMLMDRPEMYDEIENKIKHVNAQDYHHRSNYDFSYPEE